jgi:site-specific DNA-methyltransferase (adenine-specific)
MNGPRNTILLGDTLEHLRRLPDNCVDCVITSPPFFLLRDYGVKGQIGLEANVDAWVAKLRTIFAQVARVLTPTGGIWIDLGDSYSRHPRYGAPAKGLLLAPERLLLALAADGWIVRNKVVWAKSNPMPSSVGDRLNTTYDSVYFLVRSPRYFFDLDAIRVPHTSIASKTERAATSTARPAWAGPLAGSQSGLGRARLAGVPGHLLGKNPGDVWCISASSFRGAHFATFPKTVVERPLKATCPVKVCVACGAPWKSGAGRVFVLGERRPASPGEPGVRRYPNRWRTLHQPGPLEAGCSCGTETRPGLVLDPFMGSGTVAEVAESLGRDWLGIELNPSYVALAWKRLGRRPPPRAEAA